MVDSSSPRTAELVKNLGLIPHPVFDTFTMGSESCVNAITKLFAETDRQDVQTPRLPCQGRRISIEGCPSSIDPLIGCGK